MNGLVISSTGNRYDVLLDDGTTLTAAAKGNFRIKGLRTTNPVAVGDRVTVSLPAAEGAMAYITAIEPRRNYIIRRASNLSKESHILAANLDCAMLVATLFHPETSTTFIDRFLATAEAYNVPALLVFNKVDLLQAPEPQALLRYLTDVYRAAGYEVIHTSTVTGEGLDELRRLLHDKLTLISGNSGVGKSSLINALVPDARAVTAELSYANDSGAHTTTFTRSYALPCGGRIIDTPGVRGFGTLDFERHEVAHFFPEIFKVAADCRFSDCLHTEGCPACAVLEAVDDGRIAPTRYASYLSILADDTTPSKYR